MHTIKLFTMDVIHPASAGGETHSVEHVSVTSRFKFWLNFLYDWLVILNHKMTLVCY